MQSRRSYTGVNAVAVCFTNDPRSLTGTKDEVRTASRKKCRCDLGLSTLRVVLWQAGVDVHGPEGGALPPHSGGGRAGRSAAGISTSCLMKRESVRSRSATRLAEVFTWCRVRRSDLPKCTRDLQMLCAGLDAHEFSPTKGYASVDEGMSPKPKAAAPTAKVQPIDDSSQKKTIRRENQKPSLYV